MNRTAIARSLAATLAGLAGLAALASPTHAQAPPAAADSVASARPLTSKEFYVDFTTHGSVPRGSVTRAIFTVASYELAPHRIRLVVEAPSGWRVQDSPMLEREHALEEADEIEGEIYLVAPSDGQVGSTVSIKLVVEIDGDPGVAEAVSLIRIAAGGGLQPGRAGVTGSVQAYRHGMDLGAGDRGTLAGAAQLSGPFTRSSTLSLNFHRGHRLNLPPVLGNYTDSQDRYSATVSGRGWDLSAGNGVIASGNVLTGPYTRVEGVQFRRTQGAVTASVTAGRPVSFTDDGAGQVARVALGGKAGRLRGTVSLSTIERPQTAFVPGHRVGSGGLELELTPHRAHRLTVRAGQMELRTDTMAAPGGRPWEAQYSLSTTTVTAGLRARRMPASIPGLYLPGNERAADATVRLPANLSLSARGYETETERLGETGWKGDGASGGVMWMRGQGRVEVRGNYRSSSSTFETVQRTAQATVGVPLGPLMFDATAEIGRQVRGESEAETYLLRGGARWIGSQGHAFANVSYYDYGVGEARVRADLTTSLRLPLVELDGGAWATRGPNYGGTPGVWLNAAISAVAGSSVILGGEYVAGRVPYTRYIDPVTGEPLPPEATDNPAQSPFIGVPVQVPASRWRVTLGLRWGLAVPFPWRTRTT